MAAGNLIFALMHAPALLFSLVASAAALPSARVLDATGSVSNQGLLQVQTEFGFGTVCGMTQTTAGVVCRCLG